MKRLVFAVAALLAVVSGVQTGAAKSLTINNNEYEVDTIVRENVVGPGVVYAHYRVPGRPLDLHVLRTDLQNPYINLEVWNGGQAAVAVERPSSVNRRYQEKEGLDVVAVHNGDFFATVAGEAGISRMGLYGAGECIFNATSQPLFVIDNNGRPVIDIVHFNGTADDGKTQTRLHTVNQLWLEWQPDTHADQLSLFTPAFGKQLSPKTSGGNAAVLKPDAGDVAFAANTPITMTVARVVEDALQTPIPDRGAVLYGKGASAAWIAALEPGQKITLNLGTVLPSYPDVTTVREAIGGSGHIILRNGQLTNINNLDVHPRTFMGISQDGRYVYSVVADGRSQTSAGINLDDQGRVLQWLGAWHGINLDGGGSSCMIVNDVIRNRPSDGSERAVGNGVIFYSTAPADQTCAHIAFEAVEHVFPAGALVRPVVRVFNRYDVQIDKDAGQVEFAIDGDWATVNGRTLTMGTRPGKGVLTANYQGASAQQPVSIVNAGVTPVVSAYVIDNRRDYDLKLQAQAGGRTFAIDAAAIDWQVADSDIAVENAGRVRGKANGTTQLQASGDLYDGVVTVTTENAASAWRNVFEGVAAGQLTLKQTGANNLTATQSGNGFELNYTGAGTSRGSYIQVNGPSGKIATYGLPDVMTMTVNPGQAPVQQINMQYTDNRGNRGTIAVSATAPEADTETTYSINLADYIDVDDNSVYPLTFQGLRFTMGMSAKNTGYTITVPRFEWGYGQAGGIDDITVTPVTGHDDVLYNLQGIKMTGNPGPGLYVSKGRLVQIKH